MTMLWTPPIAVDGGPAPGTGYESDEWWKGPVSDLLGGAKEELDEWLDLDEPAPPSLDVQQPPRFASLGGSSSTVAVLAMIGIGAALLIHGRGGRRRR